MPKGVYIRTKEMRSKMMGHKPSEETRMRLRISHLGLPSPLKGRAKTEEHKRKISQRLKDLKIKPPSRKGIKNTEEQKVKISESLRRYLGNSTGFNIEQKYGNKFTRYLKEKIRTRDNRKCQVCSVPECECKRKLQIHHVDYNKLNSVPENLISLCPTCHNDITFSKSKDIMRMMLMDKIKIIYAKEEIQTSVPM